MYDVHYLDLSKHHYAELVALGDLHYGADNNRPLIRKCLKYARDKHQNEHPCYTVSIGDNLDHGFKFSEGNDMSPQEALEEFIGDFQPYVKDGNVLGFIEGNHDTRITKAIKSKVDLVDLAVNRWNEDYKQNMFYSTAMVLFIKLGARHTFVVFMHHGFGGGRSTGTVVNNQEKLLGMVSNPDVIITGHRHVEAHTVIPTMVADARNKKLHLKPVHCVAVGANQHHSKYAERFGLRPGMQSNSIIQFRVPPDNNHKNKPEIQVIAMRDY